MFITLLGLSSWFMRPKIELTLLKFDKMSGSLLSIMQENPLEKFCLNALLQHKYKEIPQLLEHGGKSDLTRSLDLKLVNSLDRAE